MSFKNKSVLITGGGAGIGKAAALLLAECGAFVTINCRSEESGTPALQEIIKISGFGQLACGDVSKETNVRNIIDSVIKSQKKIDILINCAGIVLPGRVDNMSMEDFQNTMDVNVKGTFLMCKYAIPIMQKQKNGCIVNIASVAAIKGVKDRAAYAASKGAIISLSRCMALDHIKDNIRINCVSPGTTLTPSLNKRINDFNDPKSAMIDFTSRQPMGRLGTPEEIAKAILFACDDEVQFMNGVNIVVDGGMSI